MKYRIMQRMETHEVVRAPAYNGGDKDYNSHEEAGAWIEQYNDQFPESDFWVERVDYPIDGWRDPYDEEYVDDTPCLESGRDNCDD